MVGSHLTEPAIIKKMVSAARIVVFPHPAADEEQCHAFSMTAARTAVFYGKIYADQYNSMR